MSGVQPRGGRLKGDFYWMAIGFSGWGNTDAQYTPIGGNLLSTTETDVDTPMDFPAILRLMRVTITQNDRTTTGGVIAFRRNAATPVGASLTIAATTTGQNVTGTLAIPLAVNDLVDIMYDGTNAGAATTIAGVIWLYIQRVVE